MLDGSDGNDTMTGGKATTPRHGQRRRQGRGKAGEGVDIVHSTVTYALAANVEDLNLGDIGFNINGAGNALDNEITGTAAPTGWMAARETTR